VNVRNNYGGDKTIRARASDKNNLRHDLSYQVERVQGSVVHRTVRQCLERRYHCQRPPVDVHAPSRTSNTIAVDVYRGRQKLTAVHYKQPEDI